MKPLFYKGLHSNYSYEKPRKYEYAQKICD